MQKPNYTYHYSQTKHRSSRPVIHLSIDGITSLCTKQSNLDEVTKEEALKDPNWCIQCEERKEQIARKYQRYLTKLTNNNISENTSLKGQTAYVGVPLKEVPIRYIERYIEEVESGEIAPFLNLNVNQLKNYLEKRYI